jgi:hypothetical protein
VDRGLGRAVEGRPGHPDQAVDRADVHDGAVTAGGHARGDQPGEQDDRLDVHGQRAVDQLLADLSRRPGGDQHGGVVDQDVERRAGRGLRGVCQLAGGGGAAR